MKKVMLKTTLSLAVTMASSQLFASGFALNEQDVAGMGTGFAGRSSSADNASTVYGNPAGMARLQGQQITGGVAAIDASTDIKDAGGRSFGSNKGDMVPFTGVPFGFYTNKLNDQWAIGFGVYAPFGLVTDYERGFQGRSFGSYSKVSVITLQPTVSYAFNDRVSIGFGPTINRISGKLESELALTPNPAVPNTNVTIKGDDTAVGFNVGVLVQATDTTRVGLTYHSKVSYKLEGHTEVSAPTPTAALLASGKYDASLKIDTPESYDLSVTQDINDAWKVYAGSTWTRWSRLKDITVNNEGVTRAGGLAAPQIVGSISEPQNWHDTWAYAVGTSYQVTKQVVLRTGLTFDQSPTNNTDRSPRIPTGDRTIFSVGLGYEVMPNMMVDLAYSYLKEEPVKVNKTNALGSSYSAKYENSANGFGLGVTYKF
ncbi:MULTISPECIES: OmpP1/FadL family transporter [Pseudomonas]|uniref:Long-chain fatty acid transport protein n=1 Tax=Pseudomonas palleroniana TaxID=191390 RepID=A0A1H5N0A1_9PSED|nr:MULTISPECIES: outer membrane protein transport protein [Pseudomonas]AVE04977.1 Long-chain fatty acid transport protein [Pseudomonas palleroniana]KAB0565529.1 transporter [Pseudomonas palleroniana]KWU49024.1 Long-chain fatty acid transport protein [Pseudomonas palleroniana]MBI6909690.1 outer membrane protein transport protein [Pseudomonas palleroniana]MBM9484563.1 outer membrane protein transport protein [Pseudomonas sp. ICBG1301]